MKNMIASILIGLFCLTIRAQAPSVDSLFTVYKKASSDTSKLATLEKLYTHYRSLNVDSAQIILDMALNLARATRNTRAEIKFMIKQGGLLRSNRSKPDLALEAFFKALKMAETHQDSSTYSSIYYGIGRVHADQGHNNETRMAFQNAIRWAKTNELRYNGLEALAVHLANEQKIVASEQVFLQLYDLIKTAKDIDDNRLRFYNNIGEFYKTYKKDTLKGLFYYREGAKYAVTDPQQDLTRYIAEMTALSKIFFELGDYNNSALYANKVTTFSYIKKDNVKESVALAYRRLFDINKREGNYKQAILYADSAIILRDSLSALINSDSLKKETYKLEAAFTLERKQSEIALLDGQRKQQRLLLVAALIIGLLLVGFIGYLQRARQRIEQQKTKLAALNATKDKLFALLSHDLMSPVANMKNIMMLVEWDLMSADEFKKTTKDLTIKVNNLYGMFENVLHWSISQMRGIKAKREKVNIKALIEEQIGLLEPIAKGKGITITHNILADFECMVDKNHIALILRNLLQNALKFTNKGGSILFICETIPPLGAGGTDGTSRSNREGSKKLIIQDNGIGMTPDILAQLFKIDENTNREGTNKEGGTGLGLILTKELVELNGGTITVSSEVRNGTAFTLTFN